jgi:hypothetical protein
VDFSIPKPPYFPGVDDGAEAPTGLPHEDGEDRQAASDLDELAGQLNTLQVGLHQGDAPAKAAAPKTAKAAAPKTAKVAHPKNTTRIDWVLRSSPNKAADGERRQT